MTQSLFTPLTGVSSTSVANSTPTGVSTAIPSYPSSGSTPYAAPQVVNQTPIFPNTPAPVAPSPTTMYSPQNGMSTQKQADAVYTERMVSAAAQPGAVPSTDVTSGNTYTTAGAKRSTYESLLQQYLDQQKQYQDRYINTLAPSAEEQALQKELSAKKTQAALNQETALNSGETSSFAGGEAQRVGRTDAIKQAGTAAQLDVLQNARLGASKQLEALIQSGDTSFKAQLEIQKLQDTVSGIDKQANDTLYNYLQKPEYAGIEFTPDPTKTPTENLNDFRKLAARQDGSKAQDLSPRQATMLNSIINQANNSPLIKAADRAVVLKDSIDNARANPKQGYVQQNLVYSYVQALDTYQSAVREGEMKAVSNLDSLFGQFDNVIQKINNGQYARPEVVEQMAGAAELLYKSISKAAEQKDKSFAAQADVLGVGEDYATYRGKFQRSYESSTAQDYSSQDKAALDAGYTQAEIDAYKQQRGFKVVGSDTNPATSQNLMSDFGGMQGLLQKARPLEMTSDTSSSMGGLLQGAPQLQIKVDIPKTSKLSFINNNPGNLRFAGQEGASTGSGGFAKFSSPEKGLEALTNQIKIDMQRGHTLASFIGKFAPPTENDTKLYIQQAVKALGYRENTPISQIPIYKLTKFIAMKESSTKVY
jgi:hypothetical protein